MHIGMHIGSSREKGEIENVASAILKIMEARADQKTIRAALGAFTAVAEVKNVTIQGCSITGDTVHKHYAGADPADLAEVGDDVEGE